MNRRQFVQSLTAVFTLSANPALLLRPAAAAMPTALAVPAQARSWAIYMSTLHGECTPQTLQNLLNIPEVDAKKYVTQLTLDGALKPNPLLHRSVSKFMSSNEDSVLSKVKKRFEMKARGETGEIEVAEKFDAVKNLDTEFELLEDDPQILLETIDEDETVAKAEIVASDETDVQSSMTDVTHDQSR